MAERCNGDGQPEAEDQDAGKQFQPVVHVRSHGQHERIPAGRDDGTDSHEQPGSDLARQCPEATGEQEHHDGGGDEREPGERRLVPGDLLQIDADDQRAQRQGGVDDERGEIADAEVADAEEDEREHRLPGVQFHDRERGE
jgi:hypothetical protein